MSQIKKFLCVLRLTEASHEHLKDIVTMSKRPPIKNYIFRYCFSSEVILSLFKDLFITAIEPTLPIFVPKMLQGHPPQANERKGKRVKNSFEKERRRLTCDEKDNKMREKLRIQ